MVATYTATNATGPVSAHGQAGNMQVEYALVTISAAPGLNDVLQFFTLPPNARIHAAVLKASDMDTSTGILIDIGDAGSATRYFSSSTVGQAGTVDVSMAAGGRFYKTTAKTAIVGLIHTAPTGTGSAGTVELAIHYMVEDSTTTP
jgi:hypothetical protein